MNDRIEHALRVETEFLAGVEAKFADARRTVLPGSQYKCAHHDELDRLRRIMLQRKLYDHERMLKLPRNRRIVWHGFDRRWPFVPASLARFSAMRRRTVVAVATVLAPLEEYVDPQEAGTGEAQPIGATGLLAHVRSLITDPDIPHVIGVCSPTGFSDDARSAALDLPGVSLVLVEPRAGGGWTTHAVGDEVPAGIRRLFDPEPVSEKVDRVLEQIEKDSAELLTGGLSADALAARLELPSEIVGAAFRQAAIKDPELRISSRSGTMVLYRGGPATMQSGQPRQSILDRIRQLFDREGDEAAKIEMFTEQRAHLAQRRDRLYTDISKLESREADLLDEGKKNASTVVRRRLAAQLAQVRKDIARQNTIANMLNQQINIISTRIHNLTLVKQGQMADIPSAEELASEAVEAEQLLEQLKADADLVGSLETGLADTMTSREEMDILREFEQPEPPAEIARKTPARREAEPMAQAPSAPEGEAPPEQDKKTREAEPN